MKKHLGVAPLLLIAIILAGSVLFVAGIPTLKSMQVAVSADDDPMLGEAGAPVSVIMFGSYSCGYTRAFWENTFPQINEQYIDTGKVRFVFRDLPLQKEVGNAELAAGCANEQNAFWDYNEMLFGTVYHDVDSLKQYAADLELDEEQFNSCLDSKKYAAEIEKDRSDAIAAGVQGTPTFFVNGVKVEGDEGFSFFSRLIDKEMAKG